MLSIYLCALGTLYPIGSVIEGELAHAVGVRQVTVGAGVVALVALGVLALSRPALFRALRDPEPVAPAVAPPVLPVPTPGATEA